MTDYTLWPVETGPGTTSEDAPVTLATEFKVTSQAWLKGIRFWRPTTAADGAIACRCWQVTTPSTGTAVPGTDATYALSGTGWQDALFTAVELTPEQRYRASVFFPSGYGATANYWSSGAGASGITQGPLHGYSKAASAGGDHQGCFAYAASMTFPDNGSPNAGNYWVTPIITDVDPANIVTLAQAVEADAALPIRVVKRRTLDQAIEADTALPVVARTIRPTPGVHGVASAVGNLNASSLVSGLEAT